MNNAEFKACIVIPCYNHAATLAGVLAALADLNLPVFVVDDASSPANQQILDQLLIQQPEITLIRLEQNSGKGAAVLAGLQEAASQGFTHALQVDADGQHDLTQANLLLETAKANPTSLVSAQPIYDASVPKGRLYSRYLTHCMVWLETLSFSIADSMCGFRVYPINSTLAVKNPGTRMDFDVEILVRLYWQGVKSIFLPVKVIYPEDGISNFRMVKDNLLMIKLHIKLLLGMVWHLPKLIFRRGS